MGSYNSLLHFPERCLASDVEWHLLAQTWQLVSPWARVPQSTAAVGPFPQPIFFCSTHGHPHLLTTPPLSLTGSHRLSPGPAETSESPWFTMSARWLRNLTVPGWGRKKQVQAPTAFGREENEERERYRGKGVCGLLGEADMQVGRREMEGGGKQ